MLSLCNVFPVGLKKKKKKKRRKKKTSIRVAGCLLQFVPNTFPQPNSSINCRRYCVSFSLCVVACCYHPRTMPRYNYQANSAKRGRIKYSQTAAVFVVVITHIHYRLLNIRRSVRNAGSRKPLKHRGIETVAVPPVSAGLFNVTKLCLFISIDEPLFAHRLF